MSDYNTVEKALSGGADPAMLCGTCPWDRFCITPPSMTKAEVDAHIEQAKAKDEADVERKKQEGKDAGIPMGALMTTLVFAGKHQSATLCPVFALRLRTSQGKVLAETTKNLMQTWDDQA